MSVLMLNDAVVLKQVYADVDEDDHLIERLKQDWGLTYDAAKKLLKEAAEAIEENRPRREFVTSYMYYKGANDGLLSPLEMLEVYELADGYGRRTREELAEINGGWDWSHIRDSTIDGWKRMETKIYQILSGKTDTTLVEDLRDQNDKLLEIVRAMANFDGRNNNKHLKQWARDVLAEIEKAA